MENLKTKTLYELLELREKIGLGIENMSLEELFDSRHQLIQINHLIDEMLKDMESIQNKNRLKRLF